jgi:hypothetical protein
MSSDLFRYVIVVFVFVFLFDGDPDVWDKLHAYAMNVEACK